MIRVLGRKEIPGRPLIYATTKLFLELFNLKDLKDLPGPKEIEALTMEQEDISLPSTKAVVHASEQHAMISGTNIADQPLKAGSETTHKLAVSRTQITSRLAQIRPSCSPSHVPANTTIRPRLHPIPSHISDGARNIEAQPSRIGRFGTMLPASATPLIGNPLASGKRKQ